ncbi:MAG TPA: methyl-accepting chemotaxis protein [Opitutaceae bacterium]
MASSSSSPASTSTATPERISELAELLRSRIGGSIKEIASINLQARVLAINAQIEAARAGEAGRAFAVVGSEMAGFATSTESAAKKLEQETEAVVRELADVSQKLATEVRGTRLGDLALTNIDLIDRNLYERSCDCRWWATDAAFVNALASSGADSARHAGERMAVILKAYTVYFDIVLADLTGTIIANGRSETYPSKGTQHAQAPWFTSALQTANGDEFGFQTVHASPLAGGQRVLIYSCKVGRGGDARAEPLGVIGIVFNWDGLAQKIVHDTPTGTAGSSASRVCITDDKGFVLADSDDRLLQDTLALPGQAELFAKPKASTVIDQGGRRQLVAHARSPGFETYRTGWHSVIIETLAK